ncbi:unnamed protein product [Chondrus crispus]|uniref:Uncharacterized protein n=1 Tax=Chondrus crispus TaxID=2769 RepID=R7Q7W9_CHOCR|nr:unnamed protein product [Chondrus crispus]CDF33466.1 unnamed protein product [Chondrus crispus]|eukprot:XP_005713269.1 unnamed protein product [Chondrus crispus]
MLWILVHFLKFPIILCHTSLPRKDVGNQHWRATSMHKVVYTNLQFTKSRLRLRCCL